MLYSIKWVIVERNPRGAFFRPVAGIVPTNWAKARDIGRKLRETNEYAEYCLVPAQGQDEIYEEDRDNVLVDSGKRIPIRWDAKPRIDKDGRKISADRIERKRIASTKRLPASNAGNPRWLVTFEDGESARTTVNASVGYGLTNRENLAGDVLVTFSPRGTIDDINPIAD